jgi:hypothetical protein
MACKGSTSVQQLQLAGKSGIRGHLRRRVNGAEQLDLDRLGLPDRFRHQLVFCMGLCVIRISSGMRMPAPMGKRLGFKPELASINRSQLRQLPVYQTAISMSVSPLLRLWTRYWRWGGGACGVAAAFCGSGISCIGPGASGILTGLTGDFSTNSGAGRKGLQPAGRNINTMASPRGSAIWKKLIIIDPLRTI